MISARRIVIPALMTAVLCVVGPIAVPLPFTPVPLSLTNFIVFLMAYILDWKKCAISYGIYILIGFVGVPVFSAGGAGMAKVFGPTGGYLFGLLFAACICSFVNEKFTNQAWLSILAMIIGLGLNYIFGTIWFMYQQKVDFWAAMLLCVIPFLVGDALKIVLAFMIGPKLRKMVSLL